MQLQPLICVHDVEASSRWYQALFGLHSGHGGADYERLNRLDGSLLLQLHRWDVEHEHGRLGDPTLAVGNGLLLWFELPDFAAVVARAMALRLPLLKPPFASENGNQECWLRDLDGYTLVLSSPLPGTLGAGA